MLQYSLLIHCVRTQDANLPAVTALCVATLISSFEAGLTTAFS